MGHRLFENEQPCGCGHVAKRWRSQPDYVGQVGHGLLNTKFSALARLSLKPTDIAKRQEIAKKLNDMVTKDSMIVVPLVHRGTLSAHSNALGGVQINAWDMETWNVADWFRVK